MSRKGDPVAEALRQESRHFTGRRYGKSVELLEDLLRRKDLKPRQRFEALCRKAESLERIGRSRAAMEILRAVVKSHPNEPLGFSLLGEYLFRVAEDPAGALSALGRALEMSPEDPDTFWWRGQVYQSGLGDLKRAKECYLFALRSDPKYVQAMESLAILAESSGRWIEAIDWRKAQYLREKKASTLSAIAELYLRLGNIAASLKYSSSAVRRARRDAAAWLTQAKALAASGLVPRASRALGRYAALADARTGPHIYPRDMYWLESLMDEPGPAAIVGRFSAK
jgi:tetratricopeptide (TPR) repeat protein